MSNQKRKTRKQRGSARAASRRVPARFFGAKARRSAVVTEGGQTFEILTILSPTATDKAEVQELYKDNRLEITNKDIKDHLDNKDYDVILSVKNTAKDDRAVATMQHEAWCDESDAKKLWVHDISRIGTEKGTVSPVKILMDHTKKLAAERGVTHLYLLVDEADKDTRPTDSTWKALTGLYSRSYGYATNISGCSIGEHRYTTMKTNAR